MIRRSRRFESQTPALTPYPLSKVSQSRGKPTTTTGFRHSGLSCPPCAVRLSSGMLKKPARRNTPVDASRSPRPPRGSNGAPKSPKARKVQVEPPSAPDFYCDTPGPETSARYVPGGYHPVHIGDIYLERYRVIHKLGYGVDSTVWLARDLFSTERT